MLTLYYAKNSCAFAAHLLLEDSGANYKTKLVDFSLDEQKTDYFRKINPKLRVPALVTPAGVLTETPAILVFIAQTHPDRNLIPQDPFLMAKAQSINIYFASTVHVSHAHKHRGSRWATSEIALSDMRSKVSENMTEHGAFIERYLLDGPWVLGDRYSLCDPYLAVISRWLEEDGVDLRKFPRITKHLELINERPSMRKIAALQKDQVL